MPIDLEQTAQEFGMAMQTIANIFAQLVLEVRDQRTELTGVKTELAEVKTAVAHLSTLMEEWLKVNGRRN